MLLHNTPGAGSTMWDPKLPWHGTLQACGWHNSLINPAGIGPTWELLEGDIMNYLVIPSLQEGRVDCAKGHQTLTGKPCRKTRSSLAC